MTLPAFKAYDIRGRVPDELNEDLARRIGVALAAQLSPGTVVVGHDVRLTSGALQDALAAGLRGAGREVLDIGLCGTEEVYFQVDHLKAAGGVMVTASHNPMDYNGMKLVKEQARPISSDTGLFAISDAVEADQAPAAEPSAGLQSHPDKSAYIAHLLSYIEPKALKPLKLVVNAGNGGAGTIVDLLAPHLPLEFIRICHEPDGSFPNGIPNPLLPENRELTAQAVREHGADFGIAWDGDFDRCFFFDHNGRFIEGYYLVGLLAQAILARQPGGKIVHDPRLTWNTVEMVEEAGGQPVLCKSGHAFIKEKMRSENAVYGGEMSAHHYFREFAYADSGMIPWLLIAALVSESGRSLADLVEARMQKFPCSGEINFKVADAKRSVARVMEHYAAQAPSLDHTDGISADFGDWRFNLRSSNTEPLLRLNVETRGDAALLRARTDEISQLLKDA
ncbi:MULTISPECIES: phosphomannomutase/phosphoglucomutase [Stenotrophomonas]|jgi:phosphomannomutase/phosphoglucomutase|uniref:phosphomannomutase n=1 Tax=Stenotrophomonas bentonitica TaxID=1450134 RepID=A0ABU9JL80_9GAMM|nr:MULTISPECIES: phosphomannomutase/phosphoglucomutase [Stenotrophomonas]MCX2919383.1 phosphomannomutase/phosphoglucomutase [Stenotrophomonas rhizophila]OFS94451.1 phosphomannomutase [Stenotrophomonas sp. HMSC10F06]